MTEVLLTVESEDILTFVVLVMDGGTWIVVDSTDQFYVGIDPPCSDAGRLTCRSNQFQSKIDLGTEQVQSTSEGLPNQFLGKLDLRSTSVDVLTSPSHMTLINFRVKLN